VLFSVGAGVNWDDFVAQAVAQNCAGVECLSGIPGSVGGTPVQNVGAYGQEVADTIESVRALDLQAKIASWFCPSRPADSVIAPASLTARNVAATSSCE
jgi:UDP-N-acetylenolpyruvoylglucosamine reductase